MAKKASKMRMGWRKRAFPALTGIGTLVVAMAILLFQPAALERYGNQLFDQYQRWQPREDVDVGVRIVDIDEESIRRIGQWPWPRTTIARMTERMFEVGAGIVAFDIVFSEPDRTSPENLRETLMSGGASPEVLQGLATYRPHDEVMGETFNGYPIVLGYFFEFAEGDQKVLRRKSLSSSGDAPIDVLPKYFSVTDSIDPITAGAYDAGFISVPQDEDNIVRKAPLLAYLDTGMNDPTFAVINIYPSLSLSVFQMYAEGYGLATRPLTIETTTGSGAIGGAVSEMAGLRFSDEGFVPTTGNGSLWVHYPTTDVLYDRVIPAWKFLDPTISDNELMAEMMTAEGEPGIVFIGTGAQGLRDLRATPVGTIPGVMVHAMSAEQMIAGEFLEQPYWAPVVRSASLLLGGILLILLVPIAGPMRAGLLVLAMIGGLFAASWFSFTERSLLFDPVYPALGLFLVFGSTSLVSFMVTEAEKSHINGAFSRYLSPDMVARIADDPSQLELGGENRDMTILFSDIRSFSRISEGMSPQELSSFLNRYLTPMTGILMKHRATVDKYIGDAVMAFWNAPLDDPDHHKNAARSALEMIDKLDEMNRARLRADADPASTLPVETSIGIGLYSGTCSVGNMGSDQRFDYSVLGDVVNTSSRLEGMTKQYGVKILVGDETARHLGDFAVVELDRAKAVGKDTWLAIAALVGDERVAADPAFGELIERQTVFLEEYRRQNFDEALELLRDLSARGERFGLGKHYEIMKERIEAYRVDPPPADWDGVYVLRSK